MTPTERILRWAVHQCPWSPSCDRQELPCFTERYPAERLAELPYCPRADAQAALDRLTLLAPTEVQP
jgi:hypothetical protein